MQDHLGPRSSNRTDLRSGQFCDLPVPRCALTWSLNLQRALHLSEDGVDEGVGGRDEADGERQLADLAEVAVRQRVDDVGRQLVAQRREAQSRHAAEEHNQTCAGADRNDNLSVKIQY